jgi:hypothetical protein
MGQANGIDHDERHDLLERNRHHREVMPAESQGGGAEKGARDQRQRAAADEAEPEVQMQVRGAEANGIGAEAEERCLCQVDLAAQAEHDRKPEHRDRERGRLQKDVEDITVEAHAGRQRHHDRRADEIGQMANDQRPVLDDGRRHRHVIAGCAHAFSATRSPKMPCGLKIRNATSTRKAKPSLYGTDT